MKIFTLDTKQGDILAIVKANDDNMNYLDFKNLCEEIVEENESNDIYIVRDSLISRGFELVTVGGSFEVNKKRGAM